jgi:hypothetical protein
MTQEWEESHHFTLPTSLKQEVLVSLIFFHLRDGMEPTGEKKFI